MAASRDSGAPVTSWDDLTVKRAPEAHCTESVPSSEKRTTKSLHDLHSAVNSSLKEEKKFLENQNGPCTTFATLPRNIGFEGTQKNSDSGFTESENEGKELQFQDEAAFIDEVHGGSTQEGQEEVSDESPRLVVVSTKIRNSMYIRHAIKSSVVFIHYKYDSMTLDSLLGMISQALNNRKVESIALIMSCAGPTVQITGKDEKTITKETITESQPIRDFFTSLVTNHLNMESEQKRLDFLACNAIMHQDGAGFAKELEAITKVPVSMSRDIIGADIKDWPGDNNARTPTNVGELYFKLERLRGWSGSNQQTLAGFEKIQTVGKGAYGAAVLYRKKDDDSLVILKEINMHDLNAAERQLALNEVSILAMLNHPNIIGYYNHFEEDGVLMIETEYADGGTLARHLTSRENPLEEKEILQTFKQIVAAIRHIHEHNILHRDLKTANIFLTKEGVVKVGDFGISKMMSSANKGANTVLGTPYYISPEMCEGKPYNEKSDIWALGCILYEMACLQKTFEGSNLPALVNKIMKGQFAPVKGNYSQEFKNMIMDMLKQDPDERPSATELMYTRIPELMSKFEDPNTDYEDELTTSQGSVSENKSKKRLRSVFLYFESSTTTMTPIELPPKIKIRHAAVGEDHVIVVTTERQVYSWGKGGKGQLGHGNTESITRPELIQSLSGKSISRACCGDGFSVFASDNGIILTCGDDSNGCLGHNDSGPAYRPRLIEPLLCIDVIAAACGRKHVAVVGSEGEVFTWGHGGDGRLGLGTEDTHCQPQEVNIPEPVLIRDVKCGVDGTMFLSDVGSVFACGNNSDNKLGLNNRQGFIMAMKNIFTKTEVEGANTPTPVRALARHRVLDISMGAHHTAVIVEPGHIYTFGRNSEGQLGIGDTKPTRAPVEVKSMTDCVIVQCGEHYTGASTTTNELYYWGLRFKTRSASPTTTVTEDNDSKSSTNGSLVNKDDLRLESITPRKASQSHSRQASLTSVTSINSNKDSMQGSVTSVKGETEGNKDKVPQSPAHRRQTSIDSVASLTDSGIPSTQTTTPQDSLVGSTSRSGFRPLSSVRKRTPSAGSGRENGKEKEKEHDTTEDDSEIIFPPMHLMKIMKSADEVLTISGFFCHGENLFVQLETTAPPPRRKKRKKIGIRKRFSGNTLNIPRDTQAMYSTSSREGGDEYSSEASEIDTQGTVPAWLKQELRLSEQEVGDDGNEADNTSDQSDDELRSAVVDASMASIQINRELAPVTVCKIAETKKPSPRETKQEVKKTSTTSRKPGFVKTDFTRRSTSTNSTESEMEYPTGSFNSDGSTKDTGARRIPDSNVIKKNLQVVARKPAALNNNRNKIPPGLPKQLSKYPNQNKGKGEDLILKEQLAARGFVSDVTVKRKQEALLNELEITREEKKRAEEKIRELEEEHRYQQEAVRREIEKKAMEREKTLESQIQLLKHELESQNSKLQDNQKVLMSLQDELTKVKDRNRSTGSGGSGRESKVCSVM